MLGFHSCFSTWCFFHRVILCTLSQLLVGTIRNKDWNVALCSHYSFGGGFDQVAELVSKNWSLSTHFFANKKSYAKDIISIDKIIWGQYLTRGRGVGGEAICSYYILSSYIFSAWLHCQLSMLVAGIYKNYIISGVKLQVDLHSNRGRFWWLLMILLLEWVGQT